MKMWIINLTLQNWAAVMIFSPPIPMNGLNWASYSDQQFDRRTSLLNLINSDKNLSKKRCQAYLQGVRSTLAQGGSQVSHLQQHMLLQTHRFSATAHPQLWETNRKERQDIGTSTKQQDSAPPFPILEIFYGITAIYY